MTKEIDKSLGDEKTRAGKERAGGGEDTAKSIGDSQTNLGGLGSELAGLEEELELVDLSARYEIEGTIGQGGMGEVLLATDRRLKRKVAIKRVRGELARNKAALGRFLTEARAVAALAHNNIVQLYDYGRDAQGPFMVMEYVDGGSLLEKCRSGPLPLEQAVELTSQVCDGLARAHDAGIIHRDIKPANILLTKDGTAKLTDFGLAKAESTDASLTITGAVLGTLDFMPPEQRRDVTQTDARSDLWSLAATLYQMVTGESPKVIRINRVPSELREALDKALEEAKEARFQSARELKESLRGCLIGEAVPRLELGSCPSCGTRNETSRRFCKKCALPLLVSCLGCQEKISLWEEVCDQCGAKQGPLLEQRKEAMAAERATAERLLGEYDFDGAVEIAKRLSEESDPRLWQLRGWSGKFGNQIEATRLEQLARAEQLVAEAMAHEQASDYPAAIHALEQIPRSLSELKQFGQRESAAQILQRVQSLQAECRRLEKLIKDRIASRQLNGLEVEVERLLRLRPDKSDAVRLREKLLEREAKLSQTRDEAFTAARKLAERHDYEAALRELARIDDYVIKGPQQQLRDELQTKLYKLQQLQEQINGGLANKKYAGLLVLVEQYLELRPEEQSMLSMREQLKARDLNNEAAVQSVVDNARALRTQGDFAGAIGLLAKIPAELESIASHDLLRDCSELAELRQPAIEGLQQCLAKVKSPLSSKSIRQKAIEGLQRGLASSQFPPLLTGVSAYRDRIAGTEIVDEEFKQLLQQCQRVIVEYERNEAQRKKFNQQVKIGAVAAGVVLLLGVVSYFVIGSSMRLAAVKQALAAGDYEAVLRLDASKLPAEALLKLAPLKNSIGLKLKLLPAGTFTMCDGDGTPHQVTLTRPFYLGVYEVTQEQYERVTGQDPSNFKGARNPVEEVSLEDAAEFCRKLSALPEEKAAGRVYRLPTEAEWEYACRAGSTTRYSFGDNDSKLGDHAWFYENSGSKTHPVGEKQPNVWGLYDMHGNVWEWCSDWYGDYPKGAVSDPVGPSKGSSRVFRGGSWDYVAAFCRSANRNWSLPSYRFSNGGFRVALSSPEISK
jgi:formylglycine-generating enzyme required for sulfatase activity/tRNA A-37 threonylcarbamoyl transferase component Bud32